MQTILPFWLLLHRLWDACSQFVRNMLQNLGWCLMLLSQKSKCIVCTPWFGSNIQFCCERFFRNRNNLVGETFDNRHVYVACLNRRVTESYCHAACVLELLVVKRDIFIYSRFTGRICPKGSSAGIVFTHMPIFGCFAPQGRHVAPIKVKFGREERTVGLLIPVKFHLDRFRGVGLWPQNFKKK